MPTQPHVRYCRMRDLASLARCLADERRERPGFDDVLAEAIAGRICALLAEGASA